MKHLTSALFLVLLCVPAAFAGKQTTTTPYSYSVVSNKAPGSSGSTQPGIALMGGGADVDAAFQWMCARAGNGDFLVIRATGTAAYNSYIKKLCPKLKTIATLIIPSRDAADDSRVAAYINGAEAIFIAGGDQSNYINFWADTPVQDALNAHIIKDAPIGGTSAGMMVLTQYLYPAYAANGVTSSEALADPYNGNMSLFSDFVDLPLLAGIVGDTHFVTRDRMGRDLAFLCRFKDEYGDPAPRAIALDEQTALLVEISGASTVMGPGKAYFLESGDAGTGCSVPLDFGPVEVYRIDSSGTFDLNGWTGNNGSAYSVSAKGGALDSTQVGGSAY